MLRTEHSIAAEPLGHKVRGVTACYAHTADAALVADAGADADAVSAPIAGLANGKQETAADVVPLQRSG